MNAHPTPPTPDGRNAVTDLSTVQLVERLTDQVSTLVRSEIHAGLAEVKSKGTRVGIGIGISGAGALLLFFGLATLTATAVLGLATVLSAWLAALIVAVAVLVLSTSRRTGSVPGEESAAPGTSGHRIECQ